MMKLPHSLLQATKHQNWERTTVRIVVAAIGAGMLAFEYWIPGTVVLSIAVFGEPLGLIVRKSTHQALKIIADNQSDHKPVEKAEEVAYQAGTSDKIVPETSK